MLVRCVSTVVNFSRCTDVSHETRSRILLDHRWNEYILEGLKLDPIAKKLAEYKKKYLIHVSRREDIKYSKQHPEYRPTGRRPGWPLKRLLDGYRLEAETGHHWPNFVIRRRRRRRIRRRRRPGWPLKILLSGYSREAETNHFIGLCDQKKKKTWMTIKVTTGRIRSWDRNRLFIGLTSWPKEEIEGRNYFMKEVIVSSCGQRWRWKNWIELRKL